LGDGLPLYVEIRHFLLENEMNAPTRAAAISGNLSVVPPWIPAEYFDPTSIDKLAPGTIVMSSPPGSGRIEAAIRLARPETLFALTAWDQWQAGVGSILRGIPQTPAWGLAPPETKAPTLELDISAGFEKGPVDWLKPAIAGLASIGPQGVLLHGFKENRNEPPGEEIAIDPSSWSRVQIEPGNRASMTYTRVWRLVLPIGEGRDLVFTP
jgi:hypothetical protein